MKRTLAVLLVMCMLLGSIPVVSADASFDSFFTGLQGIATVENHAAYPFKVHEDGSSLVSGNQGVNNSTSALKLTFLKAAALEFDYRISSEKNYDYMSIRQNGSAGNGDKASYSGEMEAYASYSLEVSAGDVVEIGYTKDSSGNRYEDSLYLKNFRAVVSYPVAFVGCPAGTAITVTNAESEAFAVENARIALPAGDYAYTAEAFGYESASGSFTVTDAALEVSVTMNQLHGQAVRFNVMGVSDGVSPSVSVTHDGVAMAALEDWSYCLVPAEYQYAVKASGYKTARGSFAVTDAPLTVDVSMIEGTEWDGTVAAAFAGGSGTTVDPYQISDGEQLAYLSAYVAAGNTCQGCSFQLTSDLDLGNLPFTPIGSSSARFCGSFDGAGHTICNLFVQNSVSYTGLFGYLGANSVIRGLTVYGSISGTEYVGGIAGNATNGVRIENCANYATVTGTKSNVGGIAGRISAGSNARATVARCFNAGTITSGTNNFCGGIVGYSNYADIAECYNVGSVSGTRAGGIAAQTSSSDTISSCYNVGSVTLTAEGSYNYAGSIVAYNSAALRNCYHLAGTVAVASGSGSANTVTEEAMKRIETVLGLGGTFVEDTKWLNSGYPILAWQDPDAKLIVSFDVNMDAAGVTVRNAAGEVVPSETDGTYRLVSGEYTYTVTCEECDPISGSFTIAGAGMTIPVILSLHTYPLAIQVMPEDAEVVLRDAQAQTIEPQNGSYALPKGAYTYEISKFGYVTQSGNLTITGESDHLTATLTEAARHAVTFCVTDAASGDALENADITVSHATGGVLPGENGVYNLPDGSYTYTVIAEGYINASGTFIVSDAAKEIAVAMQAGSNVWNGEIADQPPAAETADGISYYLITTPEELAWFAAQVNGGNTDINAKLMTNLVLNSEETPRTNRWNGIGSYDNKFKGIFDGNGKAILGYYSKYQNYVGGSGLLTFLAEGAVVKNLTIEGEIEGDGTVGAIAGQSYGRIEGCVSKVEITNKGVTGGIVGRAYASAAIVNCGNEGNVTCTLSGTYSDANVGGIVGQSYCAVNGCYNIGVITGGSNNAGKVGGILGATSNGSIQITDCYNTGVVTGTSYVGGISGRHTMGTEPAIINCYSAGAVTGSSAVGAIAGDYLGEIRNCYYLTGTCTAGVGAEREGYAVDITVKTAEEMHHRDFVLALGNTAFHLDDGRNAGNPLLAWQGGEHVANTAAAAAVAAAKEQLSVNPTVVTEGCTLRLAKTLEGFEGTIVWESDNSEVIAPDGTVVLPAQGTVYVTLTATLSLEGETASKRFRITVISLAAQDAAALAEAKALIEGLSALRPVSGIDTNICDYLAVYLSNHGYDGISVSLTSAGTVSYPPETVAHTAGFAENGEITYLNCDPSTLSTAVNFARVSDARFLLERGRQSVAVSANALLDWDRSLVEDYLSEAAASVTFGDIRGENTDEENIASNLTLPQRLASYPFVTLSWRCDSKLITVVGEAYENAVIGKIIAPAEDTQVRLYPVLTFTLNDAVLEHDGFTLTIKAEELDSLRDQMQKLLDENYLVTKLTYSITKETIDPNAVHGDIQLLIPRNTGIAEYDNYRFTVTSSDPEVAEINGYRASIYQPMPDEEPAQVTLTVTMRHREKDLAVEKQIPLTVAPLTVEELDEALILMDAAKTAYWDGINDGANASMYEVTNSLHAFKEASMGADGKVHWSYDVRDCLGTGIEPGDQADYSEVGGQENYNKFKSSNPAVIAHENLLLTQPQYNTAVTVESMLEHALYAKYAEKQTEGKWYDTYFSKLSGQHVSAVMTVIGKDGADPNGEQPPTRATVTVRLTGINGVGAVDRTFDTTTDKTVAEVLQEGFGDEYTLTVSSYGYIGSLTGSDAFNEANASVGYWGQYYFVDGAYDTASPLTIHVTDGGVYGVFANEETDDPDSYWGYKYNVWFHETAIEAEVGKCFTATVYQMAGSTAVPWSGVKVYCSGEEIGVTDEAGRVTYAFAQAGTYVITTGDRNHSYSQCVVTVTGEEVVPVTVTVRLTGVNGVGAVDKTFETTSDKTIAEVLQEGFGDAYTLTVSSYGYIGALTGSEAFNEANASVSFWGQYYYVDGAYDTSSPLTVKVTDGGVYGVFANETTDDEDSYWGYKHNVWFHESAIGAKAGADFTVTVYGMAESVAPAKNIAVFCNGVSIGRTDEQGCLTHQLDCAGTYVLTTGDSNHTYSQCVVTVTGEVVVPPCDGGADCPSRTFSDLNPLFWYHEGVDYAIRQNMFRGFEDGTFRPDGAMTRAMLVTVLYRLAGSPLTEAEHPFTDVPTDVWYEDAVCWAYANGIFKGTDDTTFAPEDNITREQIATVLFRYVSAKVQKRTALTDFTDAAQISPYAMEAMQWAVENGLLRGTEESRLEPQGSATRAQVAVVLFRLSELRSIG